MGTPVGPKYIPYAYMDRLGLWLSWGRRRGPVGCLHGKTDTRVLEFWKKNIPPWAIRP